jgi:hypothetical protein
MKPSNTIIPTQRSARGPILPLENLQPGIKPSNTTIQKIALAAFTLLIALQSFGFSGPGVQKVLQQSLAQSFPNAENVTWDATPNGYDVSFSVKGILTRISYDKNGKFESSLRNYTEQVLPFYITNMLKQKYPDNKIYGITEISSASDINYYVKLEGPKHWLTVRVDNDGNTVVVEKYRKQE